MRHRVHGRQLSRNSSHRQALMKNLLRSLVRHERVTTTIAKAKELRGHADWAVTLGKQMSLSARRQAFAWLRDGQLVGKLFDDYAKRFAARPGGYTRITRMGTRTGDGAELAQIEYIPAPASTIEKSAKPAKAKPKKKLIGKRDRKSKD